jgi:superfamily I DNA/RNA helicase
VLARLMLRFSEEEEDREDKVTLSTLHGSKGLEFGTVWFLGCDEGIIPHSRTDNPKATDVLSTIDATEERGCSTSGSPARRSSCTSCARRSARGAARRGPRRRRGS